MKIVSLNVGLPREVRWMGKIIETAIFKEPVNRRLSVLRMNIEGDKRADPSVHGGIDKALYGYAAEHYLSWKSELEKDLPWGSFGENFSVEGGLFEDKIFVGDRFRAGSAEIVAVQPRLPCFKLGIRFRDQRFVRRFAKSGRFGVYFRVLKEGEVAPGDFLNYLGGIPRSLSIGDVGRMLTSGNHDPKLLERAAVMEFLPQRLRAYFTSLLDEGM